MRRFIKLKYILPIVMVCVGMLCLNTFWGFLILISLVIVTLLYGSYIIANRLVKKTIAWNNNFIYTRQFVSNLGYRDNLVRNLDIVNVGSNPARFAFFYENIKGQNWSTGTQGLDMDFEILKNHHSYIKKRGVVLLPIVAFSSVSGYLGKGSVSYYAKFASILDWLQVRYKPELNLAKSYLSRPLRYNRGLLWYLINDAEPDRRMEITEQPMQMAEMEHEARMWIEGWKREFNIERLDEKLPEHLKKGREKSVSMMDDMISFLLEREYNPVIIAPPMSSSLSQYFTKEVLNTYVYSFVKEIQKKHNILFLDYMTDLNFQNNKLYFNPLFMNLKGRKIFTEKVLKDLQLIS